MLQLRHFVQTFEQAIAQGVAQRSEQMAAGQCATMEEYKTKVGEIRGMRAAVGLARDMLHKVETAADEGDEK